MVCSFFLLVQQASAQDEETVRVLDTLESSIQKNTDENTATAESIEYDDEATEDLPIDTAITSRLRPIPPDTLSFLRKDKGFYYQAYLDSLLRADQKNQKPKKQPRQIELPNVGHFSGIFTFFLWIIGIGTLLFVLYKLFLSNQGLFRSNSKNVEVTIDTESNEIPPDQYEQMIKKAASEGNYRLATRYLYLQSLHRLSDKGYAVIATEKTNYQYVNEIRKRSAAIGSRFAHLTLQYEYIWYGEYGITNDNYFLLQNDFREFNKQL
jgi:hypothetical protein